MEYQEPTSSDQALEASIKEIMPTLPPTVRAYLGSGKYSQVAQGLMRQYGLHVDQGGVLERELMLLIMGLSTPAEFVEHLQNEAYIPADVTRAITDAVNQQVFIPMRDEMRGAAGQGGGAPMAAAEPVGSARSAPVAQAVAAQPRVVPPPPSYGSPRPAAPVAHPPAVGAGIALPPVPPAAPQGAPAPLPVPAPAAPPAP
ncbi:hypothetical protein KGO04_02895, partial [Patescibacteria group bacterium]|nr:hypothetical protein [Patescibacteria group bacterium]